MYEVEGIAEVNDRDTPEQHWLEVQTAECNQKAVTRKDVSTT